MEWAGCMSLLQTFLEDSPLIILGSGSSMSYGLPSMNELAEELMKSRAVTADPNYVSFCEAVGHLGLEAGIDSVPLLPETLKEIRKIVWTAVNEKDFLYFDQHPVDPPKALVDLIRKVLAPTPNKASIVTTNYDRMAEYAADIVGATTVTGFEGSLIKKRELPSSILKRKRTRVRERVIDIWKVHGSLDWFKSPDGLEVAFPFTRTIPHGFQPLIIPPGRGKYSTSHDEPYRTIIAEADNAFLQAGGYLCIGYGFNDEHIQPKLLTQISMGKPIVILAKAMTPACKKHIIQAGISKYLIFEFADHSHTKVYGSGWEEIYEGQYWLLDNFMEIW